MILMPDIIDSLANNLEVRLVAFERRSREDEIVCIRRKRGKRKSMGSIIITLNQIFIDASSLIKKGLRKEIVENGHHHKSQKDSRGRF